jgi:phosphonate transport system substrate-binding protein
MLPRRFFLFCVLAILGVGCGSTDSGNPKRLTIGIVSYGEGQQSLDQFEDLKTHLAKSLKSFVEIEPALNERQAIQQIEHQSWDLVFAPPGLAAIAITQEQYVPLLPRDDGPKAQSVLVVLDDSPAQSLQDLASKPLALGQEGSATGYYLPVFNLYGLTMSEVKFAATPKAVLQLVSEGEVAAGALSMVELEKYRSDFGQTQFRVLFRDTHTVPSGSILVGPTVDRTFQEQIRSALQDAGSPVAAAAGYITNAEPPDYRYLIEVVKQVRPIAQRIKEQPAPLYEQK